MKPFVSAWFVPVLRAGLLIVAVIAAGSGVFRVRAQEGTPAATPAAEASCTADLGIVRSSKTCVNVVHASPDAPRSISI